MTLDPALIQEYRRIQAAHREHGQRSSAQHTLDAARRALSSKAVRERFERIGAICYSDYGGTTTSDKLDRAYQDYGNSNPRIRLVIAPDESMDVLDYECCPDPDTGRPDTGAKWAACDCVIDRSTNSHITPRARLYKHKGISYRVSESEAFTGRTCRYGQPCKHKCDEAQRIERDGVTGIIAQVRTALGKWIEVDSCWGFVDDDWRDSGYDLDAMEAALDYLDSGQADGC